MKTMIEAARLYELGFAILLLHPKSKRPLESRWTSGDRTPWFDLQKKFKDDYNIGVRTGSASKVGENYLACIDVDVKNPAYKDRALKLALKLAGNRLSPEVKSGSGNGSSHFYCVTKKPFKMLTIEKNENFEVCVYSDGRQMVLPPSTHPTGALYKWVRKVNKASDLPLISFERFIIGEDKAIAPQPTKVNGGLFDFDPVEVDLDWLSISKGVLQGIKTGDGVTNRSDFLLTASQALVSSGLSCNEVLSVLTDPQYFINGASQDRRGKNRKARAQWVWEYTVKKIMNERDVTGIFGPASEIKDRKLNSDEVAQQTRDFLTDRSWRQELRRGGNNGDGPPVGNIENTVLILENCAGRNVVKRNLFSMRDTYGLVTPWGGKPGGLLGDDEVVKIKYWLGQNFKVEPKNQVIEESLIILACKNAYDPVVDWLNGLDPWDGKRRLNDWLANHFQAKGDRDYLGQVFFKWILAMVTRAYIPGTKFDWMPIFEGKQGIGKSSFGRLLVGDEYFLDSLPNLTDKDSSLNLQGIWSVEMGELANMRRAQLEDIKSYITRTIDKVRPPYGRRRQEIPRRCVFFGTTNRQTYLVDDTGNRRFKPVEVGNLDFKALRRDKEQLFAEAVFFFKNEGLHELTFELSGKAKVFEAQIHQEKMVEDESSVMKEAMEDFIGKVEKEEIIFDFEKFRIQDLFSGAGPLNKWKLDARNCQFAAKMLKKFGGQKRSVMGLKYWKIDLGAGFSSGPCTLDFY